MADDQAHFRLRYFLSLYRCLGRPLGEGLTPLRLWVEYRTYTTRN